MARFQRGEETREATGIDAQLALLAGGFVRVPREIDDTSEPRDEALERAIHDSPEDDQAWLVYADFLIERGHPRGPMVALESAPVKNIVQRAEREAETRKLRHAASDVLLGSLAGRRGLSLRWKRGFIYNAIIHGAFDHDGAEALLVDLLAHPSARFLRELELACFRDDGREDHRLLAALLLHTPALPPLRKLVVDAKATDIHTALGDIAALGMRYPQLEHVRLDGVRCRLDGLALSRVTHFHLDSDSVDDNMGALAAAPWPALKMLRLELRESRLPFSELAWVLELPALRELRLHSTTVATELLAALVTRPIAGQIEALDFAGSALDEHAIDLLVNARGRFPATIRVDARMSSEARDRLDEANIAYERWWW